MLGDENVKSKSLGNEKPFVALLIVFFVLNKMGKISGATANFYMFKVR